MEKSDSVLYDMTGFAMNGGVGADPFFNTGVSQLQTDLEARYGHPFGAADPLNIMDVGGRMPDFLPRFDDSPYIPRDVPHSPDYNEPPVDVPDDERRIDGPILPWPPDGPPDLHGDPWPNVFNPPTPTPTGPSTPTDPVVGKTPSTDPTPVDPTLPREPRLSDLLSGLFSGNSSAPVRTVDRPTFYPVQSEGGGISAGVLIAVALIAVALYGLYRLLQWKGYI